MTEPSNAPRAAAGPRQGQALLRRREWVFITVLALACLSLTALHLLPAEGSGLQVPIYAISLVGKYLCYALLALSIDLIWGYCGILSLGHGAFFAIGGYAVGMHLMRQIGDRGVYGDPELPDFMVFLNWDQLPWYWLGFEHFAFALVMALLAPALLAGLVGWFAFRSRVTGVYFSIITQALTYALMLAFFRNEMGFGGNNGLTDFKDVLGLSLQSNGMRLTLFWASALALVAGLLVCRFLVTSRAGRVIEAVRDAEERTRFLGYRTERYKVFVFMVSAALAGLAGALYTPQVGIINPGEFAPAKSIEAVVWVSVGGRGTLVGAALGALGLNGLKSFFTGAAPELWLFALGAIFVMSTLLMPKGVMGLRVPLGRPKKRAQRNDSPGGEGKA